MANDAHGALLDEMLAEILDLEMVPKDLAAEGCDAWDSANHLRVIFALEERLKMTFTEVEIETATSRVALLRLLLDKGA